MWDRQHQKLNPLPTTAVEATVVANATVNANKRTNNRDTVVRDMSCTSNAHVSNSRASIHIVMSTKDIPKRSGSTRRLVEACDMTHSHMWRDIFVRVTWCIRCDMTRYISGVTEMTCNITWCAHRCGMTHYIRGMTYSYISYYICGPTYLYISHHVRGVT